MRGCQEVATRREGYPDRWRSEARHGTIYNVTPLRQTGLDSYDATESAANSYFNEYDTTV